MSLLISFQSENISVETQSQLLQKAIQHYTPFPKKVLLIPPDHTRLYSGAGTITSILFHYFQEHSSWVDIMPALGTHSAMTPSQLRMMFGESVPLERFLKHEWRKDLIRLGEVPDSLIYEWSEFKIRFPVYADINRRLLEGGYDLIISIGQVVPHEVVGMANYTKNIFVGVGGKDIIDKSHFLGAVYNIERVLGRIDTPPRRLFNYCYHHFLQEKIPILFVLSVMKKDPIADQTVMAGLFIGDDDNTFIEAARLSQQLNITYVDQPQQRVVCYLTPKEFKSTWLGNKAIYRTRMMIADGGELIILAPGLQEFGEDPTNDALIRQYGYRSTSEILELVKTQPLLAENLGATAHLIHGTSEGRFRIIYATNPSLMPPELIQSVGYEWAPLDKMMERYFRPSLADGFQKDTQGIPYYYINNPALGLWVSSSSFSLY